MPKFSENHISDFINKLVQRKQTCFTIEVMAKCQLRQLYPLLITVALYLLVQEIPKKLSSTLPLMLL